MYCPKCEKESIVATSKVIDKRNRLTCLIYRRRKCDRCGFRWTTYEIPANRLSTKKMTVMKYAKQKGLSTGKFDIE